MGRRCAFAVRYHHPDSVRHLTFSARSGITPAGVGDAAATTVRIAGAGVLTDAASTDVPIPSPGERTPGNRGRERCG